MSRIKLPDVEHILRELAHERERLTARLSEIDKLESAYHIVRSDCAAREAEARQAPNGTFPKFSLETRLVELAKEQQGELRSGYVRPILVQEGLLRGQGRTVSTRLHEALRNSEFFEPTGKRGIWRLIMSDDGENPSNVGF